MLEQTIYPRDGTKSLKAVRVATSHNDNIMVVGTGLGELYHLGINGEFKGHLSGTGHLGDVESTDQLIHVGSNESSGSQVITDQVVNNTKRIGKVVEDITTSSSGFLAVYDVRKVKIFHHEGTYQHNFNTSLETHPKSLRPGLKCVAIDKNGNVIVGDWKGGLLTIHNMNGELMGTLQTKNMEYLSRICCMNRKRHILCCCDPLGAVYPEVTVLDYSGEQVGKFMPKIETTGDEEVKAMGLVVDAHDNIYVALCLLRGRFKLNNSGHIHKYSPSGVFIGCISKGLYSPCDLALTKDVLTVADFESVKMLPIHN